MMPRNGFLNTARAAAASGLVAFLATACATAKPLPPEAKPTLGAPAPEGAIILFDGENLDAWKRFEQRFPERETPPTWTVLEDGSLEVKQKGGHMITKQAFRDYKLHLEFCTVAEPLPNEKNRGNSGVYLHGRYELQIFNSWDLPKSPEDPTGCAAFYGFKDPDVRVYLPPTEWQSYDIDFQAPRFDADGNKTQPAIVTVYHNGVLVHDAVELPGPSRAGYYKDEVSEFGLLLQHHMDKVRYRNIWLLEK